jgi:uncharacterized membrane protein YjfL (UPF0719 family)
MSPDEAIVTIVSMVVGPLLWALWLFQMSRLRAVTGRRRSGVGIIAAALAAAIAAMIFILTTSASYDVVDAPIYQFMYVVVGLAWLRVCAATFAFFGVSPRDDAVERGNTAAAFAVGGALIGVAFCYAGGNIGDGPGWWVVVFAAALATATLFIAWMALSALTTIADAVTIDRDTAAGVRLGAFLAASGLVLGRGVAGDWFSVTETVVDFLSALPPVVVITTVAVIVERLVRPTADRPRPDVIQFGLLPSIGYLAMAIAAVYFVRWPE